MRCYLVRDFNVTVLSQVPASQQADADLVQSIQDIDQTRFSLPRLLAMWNSLSGAEPLKRFRDRTTAVKRVWAALEALPLVSNSSGSKQDRLIAMLQRPSGASIEDLMSATGWQRHSVRGVLSGVVRKKRGLALTSAREGGQRIYRIAS